MNIEVLKLRNFSKEPSSKEIDIAFPVLAFECEVSVPVEKEIDVYEESILKFISIGLTKNSIRSTLNITQSLCGGIFANLEGREYIEQITKNNYKLTQKAVNFLNGIEIIDPEIESKFGYIFVSAIKKEPLWYFYEGDVFNIQRSDSRLLENKLTKEKDDTKTFENPKIPSWQLEKAFSVFCRMIRTLEKKEKDNISDEEAAELFADIESDLMEADYEENKEEEDLNTSTHKSPITTGKAKVRTLKRGEPKKLFLQIRIIFDPTVPGGFLVESPFNFNGYDNDFFLRQIQWMKNPAHNVYLGDDKFSQFMNNELNQLLSNSVNDADEDSIVFIMKKLPILHIEKDRYTNIYEDTREIIDLMKQKNLSLEIVDLMKQKNLSLLRKENIVGDFTRKLIERLMNSLFETVSDEIRKVISKQAFYDFTSENNNEMVEKFAQIIKVNRDILPETGRFFSAIKRIEHTYGNGIYEKLLNLIVYHYYQPSLEIKRFFQFEDITGYIETVKELNGIRNSALHATNRPFTDKDYDYYINHIFDVANRLLEALHKEEI